MEFVGFLDVLPVTADICTVYRKSLKPRNACSPNNQMTDQKPSRSVQRNVQGSEKDRKFVKKVPPFLKSVQRNNTRVEQT
ncbi:hypothetical protein GDO78_001311 [Eleutherodactylus coqui]|uniref:Uncharacterized protein n=1 Tax=Eleutherodactylus coqui TaxID=57060 RepID=A0A8J6FVA8_ELECQ|nr:hypothetical protein GDO78_001311 [Eleutherodactylus coqui]